MRPQLTCREIYGHGGVSFHYLALELRRGSNYARISRTASRRFRLRSSKPEVSERDKREKREKNAGRIETKASQIARCARRVVAQFASLGKRIFGLVSAAHAIRGSSLGPSRAPRRFSSPSLKLQASGSSLVQNSRSLQRLRQRQLTACRLETLGHQFVLAVSLAISTCLREAQLAQLPLCRLRARSFGSAGRMQPN